MTTSPVIAVVGGGISGMTAAYRLRVALGEGARIDVYEPAGRLGGVLHTVNLGGHRVDVGAEAFITRRPEMLDLLAELGLTDRQRSTMGVRPLVYAGAKLHTLPTPTVNGIPASAESVAGLVDDQTLERIASEPQRPMTWNVGADPSVAEVVASRFGPQVVDRLVDPLLGGVYAGSGATTGLRTAAPAVAKALDEGVGSLLLAARNTLPAPSATGVFGSLQGGYAVLLEELWRGAAAEHRQEPVTAIERDGSGWRVRTHVAARHADAVVMAVPAPRAAEILASVAPQSADAIAAVPVASSVVVALALPADYPLPANSGVLVASGEALHAKAMTFSTNKWGRSDGQTQVVRLSYGRYDDTTARATTDEQLLHWAAADLETVVGVAVPVIESVIARWIDAMPQYGPGHAEVVQRIRGGLPDGIAVAGSYLDGIGVPACVAAATMAAEAIRGRVAP